MGIIYGLHCVCESCCSQETIRYVGQTQQTLRVRLTNHRSQARFGTDQPVYRWIRKHGPENIRIKTLVIPTGEETLDNCERRIISEYGISNLLNVSIGGTDGTTLGRQRPEHSKRMRGEGHPASVFTEEQVLGLRKEYTGERGQATEFAKRFGVSGTTITDLLSGRSWSYLPLGDVIPKKRRKHFTEDEVRVIRNRNRRGETMTKLSSEFDTTVTTISHIVNRRTWKHLE